MNKNKWTHIEWGRIYDSLAEKEPNEICASSRYGVISERVVRRIESDITGKLRLNSMDTLLDLGCGTGLISINLSKKVRKATGLDFGQDVLMRAKRNFQADNSYIELVQGDIITLPFKDEAFSKVLCYSVAMCFQDYEDFTEALIEMLRVCQPGGLVLVGDIPEKNKKELWIKGGRRKGEPLFHYLLRRSRQRIIQLRYKISAHQFDRRKSKLNIAPSQAPGMSYDAETILRICREIGIKGHILDQPGSLAFGNTRVDLLVEKQMEQKG